MAEATGTDNLEVWSCVQSIEGIRFVCYKVVLPYIVKSVTGWHSSMKMHSKPLKPCKFTSPSKCSSYHASCDNCKEWLSFIEWKHYPFRSSHIAWSNVNPSHLHHDPVEVAKAFTFRLPSEYKLDNFWDFDPASLLRIKRTFKDGFEQKETMTVVERVYDAWLMLSYRRLNGHLKLQLTARNTIFDALFQLVDLLSVSRQYKLVTSNWAVIKQELMKIVSSSVATDLDERVQRLVHPTMPHLELMLLETLAKQELDDLIERVEWPQKQDQLRFDYEKEKLLREQQLEKFREQKEMREQQHLLVAEEQWKLQKYRRGTSHSEDSSSPPKSHWQRLKDVWTSLGFTGPEMDSTNIYTVGSSIADHLKVTYQSSAWRNAFATALPSITDQQKIPYVVWITTKKQPHSETEFAHRFVDLNLIKEGNLLEYPGRKTLVSYTELFTITDNVHKPCNHILLYGTVGSGKTTLISHIASQWAEEEPPPKVDRSYVKRFLLVFVLDINKLQPGMDLSDAIKDQLLLKVSKRDIDMAIDEVGGRYLIMLDGFDRISQPNQASTIIDSLSLSKGFVLVSMRPHVVNDFCSRYPGYSQVFLSGFSDQYVLKYMMQYMHILDDETDPVLRINHTDPCLKQLSSSPLLLSKMCCVWQRSSFPQQITDVLQMLIEHIVMHLKETQGISIKNIDNTLRSIGKAALFALLDDQLYLEKKELDSEALHDALLLGLVFTEKQSGPDAYLRFIYKAFQEYCAAVFWASLFEIERRQFCVHLNKIRRNNAGRLKNLMQFCCELSTAAASTIISHLIKISKELPPQAKSRNYVSTETKFITSQGGEITLQDLDLTLKIPKDALPANTAAHISLTVDTNEKHGTLQDGQFVLGPVISCRPDGLTFVKPGTLSAPHSYLNITTKCLQVWCKSESFVGEPQWEAVFDGTQNEQGDATQVIVEGNKIKFRVHHFTLYDILGMIKDLLIIPKLVLDISAYLYPINVATCDYVLLKVYALNSSDKANKTLVEDTEKKIESGMCAGPAPFIFQCNRKHLEVHVKDIVPKGKWETVDKMIGVIPHDVIQMGVMRASCEFKFNKIDIPNKATQFQGTIDLMQEGNPNSINGNGIHFFDTIAQANSGVGKYHAQDEVVPYQAQGAEGGEEVEAPRTARPKKAALEQPMNVSVRQHLAVDHLTGRFREQDRAHSQVAQGSQQQSDNSQSFENQAEGMSTSQLSGRSCRPKQRQQIHKEGQELLTPLLAACSLEGGATSSTSINLGDWAPFLKTVARGVESKWQAVALALGFTPEECTIFEQATSHNLPSWWPVFKMLEAWRLKLPPCELIQLRSILADAIRPIDSRLAKQIAHGN